MIMMASQQIPTRREYVSDYIGGNLSMSNPHHAYMQHVDDEFGGIVVQPIPSLKDMLKSKRYVHFAFSEHLHNSFFFSLY